jgi:hypothetical protein
MANVTYSEPNNILEVNKANTDNFYLVIPRIPTLQYVSSVFKDVTANSPLTPPSSGNPDPNDCPIPQAAQLRREMNLDLTNFRLYLSDATLPSVTIQKVTIGTQFADISRASKIQFNDLEIEMIVSENLIDYNAILYWMYGLHNPEEYNKLWGGQMINEYMTDIYLIITNNHQEKVNEFKFIDAFPISLSPIQFSYKSSETIRMNSTWAHSGMVPSNNYVLRYI